MLPRAYISYLVSYDSTNIFRIWIPSQGKVIRTRDVSFDPTVFYDPSDIDLIQILESEDLLSDVMVLEPLPGFTHGIVEPKLTASNSLYEDSYTNDSTDGAGHPLDPNAISDESEKPPETHNLPTPSPSPSAPGSTSGSDESTGAPI